MGWNNTIGIGGYNKFPGGFADGRFNGFLFVRIQFTGVEVIFQGDQLYITGAETLNDCRGFIR